jgi:outer membrane PBP1 activator LpoA protein
MRISLSIIIAAFILAGCATNATVSPSQNPSLQAVSPNTAADSQGGAMQRSLDTWLKEEWTPLTAPAATRPKEDATQRVEVDSTASKAEDEKPFTLQSFADKWKVYHENEAKMKEGKPKEASYIDAVNALPAIGK